MYNYYIYTCILTKHTINACYLWVSGTHFLFLHATATTVTAPAAVIGRQKLDATKR